MNDDYATSTFIIHRSSFIIRYERDMSQTSTSRTKTIGLWAAVAIGIGGMIGAGIFSILGVVAQVSGSALPVSFAVGGVVALLAAYSYARLGVRYPSVGGAVQFLVQGFGDGILSGALNIFQYVGYVIAIALYANGFAGYARTFLPSDLPDAAAKALAVGVVAVFVAVNFLGTAAIARAETAIVALNVAVLSGLVLAGIPSLEPGRFAVSTWPSVTDIVFGAGILFICYEGFGLVANAAGDMADPRRDLPRALAVAVLTVIAVYVLVALTVAGHLSVPAIEQAQASALADAARSFLGEFGYRLISVAALFATSSAVNATLFGAANVGYQVAKDGQLPDAFTRQLWSRNVEGLFITSGLVILFVLLFDLGPIAMMGSAAFLIVYAAVNAAHLRVRHQTGASPAILWASLIACLAMFVLLMVYIVRTQPVATPIALLASLAGSFLAEWLYRRRTGRAISLSG
jgi:amino acid transporter